MRASWCRVQFKNEVVALELSCAAAAVLAVIIEDFAARLLALSCGALAWFALGYQNENR
jgi:hypothetical protein